jgi:hypothetical protein
MVKVKVSVSVSVSVVKDNVSPKNKRLSILSLMQLFKHFVF